jgi:hypothetical protein
VAMISLTVPNVVINDFGDFLDFGGVWPASHEELTDITTQKNTDKLHPYFYTQEGKRISGKHIGDYAHLLLSEQIKRLLK